MPVRAALSLVIITLTVAGCASPAPDAARTVTPHTHPPTAPPGKVPGTDVPLRDGYTVTRAGAS